MTADQFESIVVRALQPFYEEQRAIRGEIQMLSMRLGEATLTPNEACARLRISLSTLYRLKKTGVLTALGTDKRPRYDASQVEHLAKNPHLMRTRR